MTPDRSDAVHRELLARHLGSWVPAALRESRRATFVQAYQGADGGAADGALRAVAAAGPRPDRQLTIVTLAGGTSDPVDLPTRLGAAEADLPRTVALHLLAGGPAMIPVALTAATAAWAPLFCHVDLAGAPAPEPPPWAALTVGRPAELLICGAPPSVSLRATLTRAGFPLVTEVEMVLPDEPGPAVPPARGATTTLIAFATGSGRRIEAFKDALWGAGALAGAALRIPGEQVAAPVPTTPGGPGELEPLRRVVLDLLAADGPQTVAELRSVAVTRTVYRPAHVNRALGELLDADLVRRDPVAGRLGGDVRISALPAAGPPVRSSV
ncbi:MULTISPECIES: hypothetical protein [unclassified Solwaraspora]|uniref:hypothetical protein n=1 Tax=unclassified Solwaraspora TaxID=2627926 RepID=UPI00259B2531|nr:hypothetical protein [Solwaraspora sp. WMMA2056]WJK39664.1 hypothetical protein O7608_24900 [Solwaraspora sp. WMMA2056]